MAKEDLKIKFNDPEDFIKRFDRLFYFVVGAMLIGFLSLLFMVAGLVVDSWRFNSTVYKESKLLKLQEDIINQNFEQQKLNSNTLESIKQQLLEMKTKQ
ncbi:MAG: hypothetical protein HYW51_02105 [Candidatus Doudnabacteria bacterium]|nr:hypothetical protein [Candidatus Doudnabacteria bacterium]